MDIYTVKKGDTLEKISETFNIPINEILKVNNLIAPYNIVEGQLLNIPLGTLNIFNYYTVEKNDTLYAIATKNSTTVETIASINGLNPNEYIYPGQTLLIPMSGIRTYITAPGDTMLSVANYFNTTPLELLYDNNNVYLLPEQLIVYRR